MKNNYSAKQLVIYQAKSGAIELRADTKQDTIWATQKQLAQVFEVDVRTVNEHIKNIYRTDELKEDSTIRKFRTVKVEGLRQIARNIDHYNLDMIISVGYRVNSKKATIFRQWATKTLKSHIVDGYTINRSRIKQNYTKFLKAVDQVRNLLSTGNIIDNESVLELVKLFAHTWFSLDAYDKSKLPVTGATQKQAVFIADDLVKAISQLKKELLSKGEATDLFSVDRDKNSLSNIVSNVFQSYDNNDLYPSTEEKAAHLLYFVVKNHPFIDGNKRCGAFSFIWFLRKAKLLNIAKITPEALIALTILVVESDPKDKPKIIGLILLLLKK